jgi:hypothetical protein
MAGGSVNGNTPLNSANGNGAVSPGASVTENPGSTPEDIDFDAIMQLMTAKYTVDLVDRHVGAIRKICKTCRNGFLLLHLEQLVDLLRLVIERFAQGQQEFAPAICEFTRVSAQPFVSCKASDMRKYGQWLPTFIKGLVSVLSYALPSAEDPNLIDDADARNAFEERRAMNERIRIEIAHTLACWSRFGLDEESVELRPNQPLIQAVADAGTPNLRILQQSQVMDELSASFRVEDSPEAIVITLGAIRDMSLYRPLARQITNCGLISNLLHVIRVNLLGSDVLLVAAEVLWNVLELDWDGAAEALGHADVIESFRDFMDAVLTKGYRFKDKIFRNDMMVLLMYISKRVENREFFATTGLMALLLCHAITEPCRKTLQASGLLDKLLQTSPSMGLSTAEMFNGTSKQGTLALSNSQEDMEFRILLWGTLARCCSNEKCAQVANDCLFVQSLLSYLDSNRLPADQRQWSQEQRRKMQLEALSALFLLVQYMPEAFINANGNSIVLQLLQETNNREVQKKCLHLLQIAVRMGPEFAEELGKFGAVGALIELFTDRDVPMNGKQLCISVLAGLCSGHAENCREFRKKGGVEAIREEVVYRPDETTDNHLYCTLCVVDCIWSAIVGTRKNEVRFLDAGGLFALLDVLEIAPLLLKRQIIGCLADLVQYKRPAKLFVQWNSQVTMKGGLKILLELWQNEQEVAGSTTRDGVIHDLDRPLNPVEAADTSPDANIGDGRLGTADSNSSTSSSKAGERIWQAKSFADTAGTQATRTTMRQTKTSNVKGPDNPDDIGTSITDRQDCRAKIFSILSCIGFECNEALNIAERQQMELVKLYPECVQLEAWIKVQENLAARNIKPISADRKWIEDSITERKAQTTWVYGVQMKLSEERQDEEKLSLHRFYEDIRSRAQFRKSAKDGPASRLATPALEEGNRMMDDTDNFGY